MKSSSKLVPIVFSVLVTLFIFWKLPVKGLVPVPGTLLTGRLFPWSTQKWDGYPAGVPYKEFVAADTVRQTYPWRKLVVESYKSGELPLWNPYSFSGTPLLANVQSAAFYPLNLLFMFLNFDIAWVILILLQPILSILFTYLYLRQINLDKFSALFSGLAFGFSGYMLVWLELGTVGHAALWLPLALYATEKLRTHSKSILLIIASLLCSIFAGHTQTTIYLLIVWTTYLFTFKGSKKSLIQNTKLFLSILLSTFLLALPQILPTLQLWRLSARGSNSHQLFDQFLLPVKHLVTFLIPNYFGNPATNNFWGQDYGEFMAYFGVTAFVLALSVILSKNKTNYEKYFTFIFIGSLLLALNTPIASLIKLTNIPILSSSGPSRILFITQFAGSILAGMGLQRFTKNQTQPLKKSIMITGTIYTLLLTYTLWVYLVSTDPTVKAQINVALRNTVFPLANFVSFSLLVFLSQAKLFKTKPKPIFFISTAILINSLIGYSIFANKYLPFSPLQFNFPSSPIFAKASEFQNQARFFGDGTSSVMSNVWIPHHLYSAEGYDPLFQKRYGQLIQASYKQTQGKLIDEIPRSDVNLETNVASFGRQRIQDLLGVSLYFHSQEFLPSQPTPDHSKFPLQQFELLWQQDNFQIYKSQSSLPRAYLVDQFQVISRDDDILSTIFDPGFDPASAVILENEPSQKIASKSPDDFVKIIEYTPNHLTIETQTQNQQLLVLSDTHYPGWKATIDGEVTQISRANFVLRSIVVPSGKHLVQFQYQPSIKDFLQSNN